MGGSFVLRSFSCKPELKIIAALFDKGCEPITLGFGIILHSIAQGEFIFEDITADIERSIQPRFLHRKRPVHPHIFGFGVAVIRALRIHYKAAIRVELMDILPFRYFIGEQQGVIVAQLMIDAVDTIAGIETGERIEMMVLVAGFEDECLLINITQTVGFYERRLRERNRIVQPVILRYNDAYFLRISDVERRSIDTNIALLLAAVKLLIGIRTYARINLHDRIHYAKQYLSDAIIRITVFIDGQPIVAALGKRHVLVRKIKPIVGIFATRID